MTTLLLRIFYLLCFCEKRLNTRLTGDLQRSGRYTDKHILYSIFIFTAYERNKSAKLCEMLLLMGRRKHSEDVSKVNILDADNLQNNGLDIEL